MMINCTKCNMGYFLLFCGFVDTNSSFLYNKIVYVTNIGIMNRFFWKENEVLLAIL